MKKYRKRKEGIRLNKKDDMNRKKTKKEGKN